MKKMEYVFKFRGKSKLTKEWVEGYFIEFRESYFLVKDITSLPVEINKDTLGLKTNFSDKNHQKLYQGDIVTSDYTKNGRKLTKIGFVEVSEDSGCIFISWKFSVDINGKIVSDDNPNKIEDLDILHSVHDKVVKIGNVHEMNLITKLN